MDLTCLDISTSPAVLLVRHEMVLKEGVFQDITDDIIRMTHNDVR